jgi:hypothetical protein
MRSIPKPSSCRSRPSSTASAAARGSVRAGPALDRQGHRRAQLVPVRRQRALARGRSEFEHYSDSGGKSGGQKEKLAYTILAASLAYQFGLEWGAVRSRSFRFVVIDEAFGRGSDESAQYGLKLFQQLNLQLLIVTPLQKIHIIEPFVSSVGFVHNEGGRASKLRNLSIEEYRAEPSRDRAPPNWLERFEAVRAWIDRPGRRSRTSASNGARSIIGCWVPQRAPPVRLGRQISMSALALIGKRSRGGAV